MSLKKKAQLKNGDSPYEEIPGNKPRKRYRREEYIDDFSSREQSTLSPSIQIQVSILSSILNQALQAFEREKKIPGVNMTEERFQKVFKFSRESLLKERSWSSDQLKKMGEQMVNRRLCQLLNLDFSTKEKENQINHKKFIKKIKQKFSHEIPSILDSLENMEQFLQKYFSKDHQIPSGKSIRELSYEIIQVFEILKVKNQLKKAYPSQQKKEQAFLWTTLIECPDWTSSFFIENYSISSVGY